MCEVIDVRPLISILLGLFRLLRVNSFPSVAVDLAPRHVALVKVVGIHKRDQDVPNKQVWQVKTVVKDCAW